MRGSSHRLELGGGAACDVRRNPARLLQQSHLCPEYDSLDESEMARSARGQKQLLAPLAAAGKNEAAVPVGCGRPVKRRGGRGARQ